MSLFLMPWISEYVVFEDLGRLQYLTYGTQRNLVRKGYATVLRLLECLYQSGYNSGWITVNEAELLIKSLSINAPRVSNKSIRRQLEKLGELIEDSQAEVRTANMGDYFPISATMNKDDLWEKIAPRRHKEGMGTGGKKGRPVKRYWIPSHDAMNEVFGGEDDTRVVFPLRALTSKVDYKAAIWKIPVLKNGGEISTRQSDMAAELNNSRSTQKRYAERSGTKESGVYERHQLSQKEISHLPRNHFEQQQALKYRETRYAVVYDERGNRAHANQEDISLAGLTGGLYADIRTKTTYTDVHGDAWIKKEYPAANL